MWRPTRAVLTAGLLLAIILAEHASAQQHTNRSCARGPDCTVCDACCIGQLLSSDCDYCVEMHCRANRTCVRGPECTVCDACCIGILLSDTCDSCVEMNCHDHQQGESVAALLSHLVAFVRVHKEIFLTALATLPIVGRLSDFSLGVCRRAWCPRRKAIVMSCPEVGTRRVDGRGPYEERVMDKVAELQRQGRLKMGFDRAGTSTQHPADAWMSEEDWRDAAKIRRSQWMYGFTTAAKKVLAVESQSFDGILVVICIKGGPVTAVEHEQMDSIITDATADAQKSKVACRTERRDMSYAEFLREYDEGCVWRVLCCWCPRCVRSMLRRWVRCCECCRCCSVERGDAPEAALSQPLPEGVPGRSIGDAALDSLLSSMEPEPESEPSSTLSRPASPERQPEPEPEVDPQPEPATRGGYTVGQTVWCKSGCYWDPWNRGVVTGFKAYGDEWEPLVCVTEGLVGASDGRSLAAVKALPYSEEKEALLRQPFVWATGIENQQPRIFENYRAATHPGYTFKTAIMCEQSCWVMARAMNGQSQCGALLEATAKLLGWHWLQPSLYWALLAMHWGDIDAAQRVFGVGVAVREALYFLSTCVCLWTNPAFLLVDIGATVRDERESGNPAGSGYPFLLLYAVAPEKFVAMALFGWNNNDEIPLLGVERKEAGGLYSLGCLLLDVCSVGALVAGLASARLPAGLAIGYTATAVAMLSFLGGPAERERQDYAGQELDDDDKWKYRRAIGCEACLVATMLALVVLTVVVVAREQ